MKSSTIAAFVFVCLAALQAQQPQPAQQPQQPAAAPAQGQGGGRGPQPAAGAPAKPYIPLAASTLLKKPEAYYGEMVTVTATVDAVLSKTSISIDQDKTKSTGNEVLVLAPTMNGTVDLNSYVTVIGELMPF